jgi:hypothetical protein
VGGIADPTRRESVYDIIDSVPWCCDWKDGCKQGWHLCHYWISDSGYTYDQFADGDHEEIEEADLPTHEESQKAWRKYYRYVFEHGTDPIGQFAVQPMQGKIEFWYVFAYENKRGVYVGRVQKRKDDGSREKSMDPSFRLVPDELRAYMLCDKEGRIAHEEIESLKRLYELADSDEYITEIEYNEGLGLSFRLLLRVKRPNPDYDSQLRAAAKSAIDQLEKENTGANIRGAD